MSNIICACDSSDNVHLQLVQGFTPWLSRCTEYQRHSHLFPLLKTTYATLTLGCDVISRSEELLKSQVCRDLIDLAVSDAWKWTMKGGDLPRNVGQYKLAEIFFFFQTRISHDIIHIWTCH